MSDKPAEGPVPVRELMERAAAERAAAEREAAGREAAGRDAGREPESGVAPAARPPAWSGTERRFDAEGVAWIARSAGAGSYGTGRTGAARLVAVHFYRAAEPGTPVREALVAAAAFPHMLPEELCVLLDRATPIEPEP